MTATVNEALAEALLSLPYDVISTTIGLATILILTVLLFRRDARRLLDASAARRSNAVFDVVVGPFLVVFFLVITTRLAELIL